MAGVSFSPEKDIPNLSVKVILITGGLFLMNHTRRVSYLIGA